MQLKIHLKEKNNLKHYNMKLNQEVLHKDKRKYCENY